MPERIASILGTYCVKSSIPTTKQKHFYFVSLGVLILKNKCTILVFNNDHPKVAIVQNKSMLFSRLTGLNVSDSSKMMVFQPLSQYYDLKNISKIENKE